MMMCPPGEVMDPTKGCGCISEKAYRSYFPDWATEKDIDYSFRLGYQNYEYPQEPLPVDSEPIVLPSVWPEC